MRFDDMLATTLAQPVKSAAQRQAKWRQLIDLLAQRWDRIPDEQAQSALEFLRDHRSEITPAMRIEIARSLCGRRVSPMLIAFFAEDDPSIAAPLIAGARLTCDEWLAILPSLGPTARALLRHRRDLSPQVEQALAAFGSSDFVIAGTKGLGAVLAEMEESGQLNPAAEGGGAQIRELVARIEAFRKQRPLPGDRFNPGEPLSLSMAFRWETGPEGTIIWVEDAPRGPLIGQTIARVAGPGEFGVDGQAAGAFEKRAPFRDARFSVAGAGAVAGDWRISGVPFFDAHLGNFLGYRGTARRPRVDEVAGSYAAAGDIPGLFGTNLPPDSLRQLIHELRTPLNAIVGFAEMIEGQYMGPAGAAYRSRSKQIMDHATRLLSAVDDLDTAARIETSRLSFDESAVDAVALLCRLHEAYEKVASQRNSRIALEIAPDLPAARVESSAAERMFARMLAATIGLAREGETITTTITMSPIGGQDMLCLSIDRPQSIESLSEPALLDPGYSPDGDWPGAPALGLGFALRLVRNLAEAVGGALIVGDRRFFLYLPPVESAELSSGQGA